MTAKAGEASVRYRVTAAYITVHTASIAGFTDGALGKRSGIGILGFYQHAILPSDVPDGDIAHLLAKGMIEPVEAVD